MHDDALYRRVCDGLLGFYRFIAAASPGASLWEPDGVTALVSPGAPERSFCNAVNYSDPAALGAALPELEHIYDEAGVRAWTVWVHAPDRDVAAALARAGHVLDANPAAMAAELERFEAAPSPELDIRAGAGATDVARINDAAYGYDGDFEGMLTTLPEGAYELYVACVDGAPSACTGAFRHGDNCDITLVATLPQARGHGLATELMKRALVDARASGCSTTTLVATKMGEPIYERLGYRNLRPIEMWERRRP
jgi:GNAT superfamily N-acetyltransferase